MIPNHPWDHQPAVCAGHCSKWRTKSQRPAVITPFGKALEEAACASCTKYRNNFILSVLGPVR